MLNSIRRKHIFQKLKKTFCSTASLISPKLNSKICFLLAYGRRLNLSNPSTLDEKLMWLKLNCYIKDPLVIQCADKYRVREYVTECGCASILNELIAVYRSPEEIIWTDLPQKFVLKWNFGAGMNIISPDKSKLNEEDVKTQMTKWGKTKPWLPYSEFQYKYAPKRIVCEKLIESNCSGDVWVAPEDYKVYCFNGVPKYILVCVGRGSENKTKYYFFNTDWTLARINMDSKNAPVGFRIEKPKCYDELMKSAMELSRPFPFVRADFYVSNDKLFFGELTFTPGGCLDYNRIDETNRLMGDMLTLPQR